jgi:predicted nuclease with TOPRIM domain
MNIDTPSKPDLLDEQFRLERDIAEQTSIKTEDSFTTTYSSLQMIVSQMQIKLASAFLQETEYLKEREQRLDQDEQSLTKRMKQLKNIQIEREQLEKEFSKLKDRLETAIIHLTKFQTDGVGDLFHFLIRNLFFILGTNFTNIIFRISSNR